MNPEPSRIWQKLIVPPPRLHSVLLVDDNDDYADKIKSFLEARNVLVQRAHTAKEGIRLLKADPERYDGIITDISMENQVSGLAVLIAARTSAFKGVVTVASTGLDTRFGLLANRILLGHLFGSRYLIPKKPIRQSGTILWLKR